MPPLAPGPGGRREVPGSAGLGWWARGGLGRVVLETGLGEVLPTMSGIGFCGVLEGAQPLGWLLMGERRRARWAGLLRAALLLLQPAPRARTARTVSMPASVSTGAPVTPSQATARARRAGLAWPARRVSPGQTEEAEGPGSQGGCPEVCWHAPHSVGGDGFLPVGLRCDLLKDRGPRLWVQEAWVGWGSPGPSGRGALLGYCALQSASRGALEPAVSTVADVSTAASVTGPRATVSAQPAGLGTSVGAVSGPDWGLGLWREARGPRWSPQGVASALLQGGGPREVVPWQVGAGAAVRALPGVPCGMGGGVFGPAHTPGAGLSPLPCFACRSLC